QLPLLQDRARQRGILALWSNERGGDLAAIFLEEAHELLEPERAERVLRAHAPDHHRAAAFDLHGRLVAVGEVSAAWIVERLLDELHAVRRRRAPGHSLWRFGRLSWSWRRGGALRLIGLELRKAALAVLVALHPDHDDHQDEGDRDP